MAELGHADLAPDVVEDVPDVTVDEELTWGPGFTPETVVDVRSDAPAAEAPTAARGYWRDGAWVQLPPVEHSESISAAGWHERRIAREGRPTGPRVVAPMPVPEVRSRPMELVDLPSSAGRLAAAAVLAGWVVTATYSRGPFPTEKSRCARCGTWQGVTKEGALKVHGPRTDRCPQTALDPASPSYQMVDAVVVRAASPRGHRLAAMWVDDTLTGDGYSATRCELQMRGDRPRAADVVALRSVLKAQALPVEKPARKPRAPRVRKVVAA
jgi:hypothetical protein